MKPLSTLCHVKFAGRPIGKQVSFSLLIALSLVVAACGRQVTPNPPNAGPGGAGSGQIAVLFDVAAPFNFSSYQYWIIFNTTGDGVTPSTLPFQNNWDGYSDGIEIGGLGGATFATPWEFLHNPSQPKAMPALIRLGTTPQQFQYSVNSNGTGTEFSVIFSRVIFNNILNSPGPSPPPVSTNWTYNAFTTQANVQGQLVFVDSMGAGGPQPPQYVSPTISTTQCSDQTFYALSSGLQIDPPAQIVSVEIGNNPSPNPC
jgi:hypothetical protein